MSDTPVSLPQETTSPLPPYMVGLPTANGVQLSWSWITDGSGAVALDPQEFTVMISQESWTELQPLVSLGPDRNSLLLDSLKPDQPYYFQIQALHTDGQIYSSSPLSVMPAYARSVRQMGPEGGVSGTWKPDGNQIAFTQWKNQEQALFVYSPETRIQERIAGGDAPDWNQVTGSLVYVTDLIFNRNHPDSSTYLGLMDQAGQAQILAGGAGHLASPAWANHGRQIAYLSTEGLDNAFRIWVASLGAVPDAYVVSPEFPQLEGLIDRESRSPMNPRWHPSDKYIVYDRLREKWIGDSMQFVRDIFRVPSLGGGEEELIVSPWTDAFPAFSPDGSRMAFISDRSGIPCIWTASLDAPESVRLLWWGEHPRLSLKEQKLSWSPTGKEILFTGWASDSTQALYSIPVE